MTESIRPFITKKLCEASNVALFCLFFLVMQGCGNLKSSGGQAISEEANDPYQHENLQYIFDDNALPVVTITLTREALEKKLALFDQNSRHETEVRASFTFDKNGVVDQIDSVAFG